MLTIYTNYGSFGHFKDVLLFMQEEEIECISITNIEYCLDKIFGAGVYTLKQIKQIVESEEV